MITTTSADRRDLFSSVMVAGRIDMGLRCWNGLDLIGHTIPPTASRLDFQEDEQGAKPSRSSESRSWLAASIRDDTPSLRKLDARWLFTVLSERNKSPGDLAVGQAGQHELENLLLPVGEDRLSQVLTQRRRNAQLSGQWRS